MIGFDLFFDKINQLPFPNHSKMCANYIKRHFQAKVSNITVNSDILTLVVKLHHEPHLFHYCCRKNAFDTIKMGKSNQISKEKRAQIVILSQAGSSQRKIAQFVGVSRPLCRYLAKVRWNRIICWQKTKWSAEKDNQQWRSTNTSHKQAFPNENRAGHKSWDQWIVATANLRIDGDTSLARNRIVWSSCCQKTIAAATKYSQKTQMGKSTPIGRWTNGNRCFGQTSPNSKFSEINGVRSVVESLVNGTNPTVSSQRWSSAVVR